MNWQLKRAVSVLESGGVVAHATEAVMGLAASVSCESACERLRVLKQRPHSQPFLLVAASLEQLRGLVNLTSRLRGAVLDSWPGAVTWILPAASGCPEWLVDRSNSIAVRVTNHRLSAELALHAGPYLSTSANPATRPPARNLMQARKYFATAVDHYLPGSVGSQIRPSQIWDGKTGRRLR